MEELLKIQNTFLTKIEDKEKQIVWIIKKNEIERKQVWWFGITPVYRVKLFFQTI